MQDGNTTYTKIPNAWDDLGLDPCAYRLLTHYARRGDCYESMATTAAACHMSIRTLASKRDLLQKRGLIEVTRQSTSRTLLVRVSESAWMGAAPMVTQESPEPAPKEDWSTEFYSYENGDDACMHDSASGMQDSRSTMQTSMTTMQTSATTRQDSVSKKFPTTSNDVVGDDDAIPGPAKGWTLPGAPGAREYFRLFRRKRWANLGQKETFEACEAEVGADRMVEAVRWAAASSIANVNSICTAARKGRQAKRPPTPSEAPAPRKDRWRLDERGKRVAVRD